MSTNSTQAPRATNYHCRRLARKALNNTFKAGVYASPVVFIGMVIFKGHSFNIAVFIVYLLVGLLTSCIASINAWWVNHMLLIEIEKELALGQNAVQDSPGNPFLNISPVQYDAELQAKAYSRSFAAVPWLAVLFIPVEIALIYYGHIFGFFGAVFLLAMLSQVPEWLNTKPKCEKTMTPEDAERAKKVWDALGRPHFGREDDDDD